MPLPPAPNKRATLLAPEFYHLKAAADPRDTVDEREPAERVDGQPMTEAPAATARPRKRQTPVATAPTAPRARGTRRAGTAPAENEKTADTAENRPAVPTPPPSPAQPPAARTHETRARPVRGGRQGPARLFVLDTNVLLHDPTSLFRFEE